MTTKITRSYLLGLSTLAFLATLISGCEDPPVKLIKEQFFLNIDVCTLDLTAEATALTPCLTGYIETLRNAEPETQVGCLMVVRDQDFDAVPVYRLDESDETIFVEIGHLDELNLPVREGGVELALNVRASWFFIPDATPATCELLTSNSSCATVEGCVFGIGPSAPVQPLPEPRELDYQYLITGQDAAGLCQYQTADGFGLIHPELCDGRDNDCNGAIDDALMCMPEPEPEPEPECADALDCDMARPLCIEGSCRACQTGLLECESAAQPICDVSGVCRGCQADAECGEGLSCDVATGICVQCQSNQDCPAHSPFCGANGQCEGCNPLAQGQCPEGQSCLDNGTCGTCQANNQCPGSSPICNEVNNLCEGCGSDSDCPNGTRCYENICRECIQAGHVPGQCYDSLRPVCDIETFSCRSCRSNDECGDNRYCFQGRCGFCDPQTSAGCESTGFICDGEQFTCEACISDAQCAGAYADRPICSPLTQRCVPCDTASNRGCTPEAPTCITTSEALFCGPCASDSDCFTEGAVCNDGRCQACATDDDCEGGLRCANINGTRTCAPCDPEQPVGQNGCVEINPLCTPSGECASCITNADCPTRLPVCGADNQCRACQADLECSGVGLICGDGICTTCDASRSAPDNPSVDFGCTPEQPNCQFGGTRCRP